MMDAFTTDELKQVLLSLNYLATHRGFGLHPAWGHAEHMSATDKIVNELAVRGVEVMS